MIPFRRISSTIIRSVSVLPEHSLHTIFCFYYTEISVGICYLVTLVVTVTVTPRDIMDHSDTQRVHSEMEMNQHQRSIVDVCLEEGQYEDAIDVLAQLRSPNHKPSE